MKMDTSYSKVSTTETMEENDDSARAILLDSPGHYKTRQEYLHIPEARDLIWEDNFFEDDDDIVAAFDFDYEGMESFNTQMGFVALGFSLFYPPVLLVALGLAVPCYIRSNARWTAKATHVAVTRDGVRLVHDQRQTCFGCKCSDAGKQSKTVPFDKITDCDVTEPAGNACLCLVKRILHIVNIDTASSSQERHELQISGIFEPYKFKKLVWAMKRQQQQQQGLPATTATIPQALEMVGRSVTTNTNDNSNGDVISLLREIRDELRENNEAIKAIKK